METSPQGRMVSLRGFLQKFRPQKALPFLKSLLPYALIFIVSVAPFWVWMSRGDMTGGDDVSVHLSLVYDLLEGFKRGFIDGPNHVYLGNYAINANLKADSRTLGNSGLYIRININLLAAASN